MKKNITIKKCFIKSGDNVKIITGNYKNQIGKVKKVDTKRETIIIEGINLKTHFIKSRDNSPGSMIKKEAGIHISNAAVLKDNKIMKSSSLKKYRKIESKQMKFVEIKKTIEEKKNAK